MAVALKLEKMISEQAVADIEHWRKKYPVERKRPPILAALHIIQKENNNSLNEPLMQALADYLDVPHIAVYEVATFYSMYHTKPVGKTVISVCTNLSCMLCGSKNIVTHLEKRLNIRLGETTEDGAFTLKEVECMAACGGAPMLEVKEEFHENLTTEKVDHILAELGVDEDE
ncbi:NAD(P)H-dependent oxidoreductase subunit E [Pleionea sp. CnH1-48]|uniref:NADH-quinone oxidoreductase subunit NuoE family protein n=1 Tax=Pleionea sp. CnH1-48 TaxID=2954494 RepID=UPI002097BEC2|nr:NAD(P)H-dependent oxidoreductase subunit E [Pleionea sp. CnH1-48]MCO7225054.1 NAD(P)H-dependent oxidoreductase subunit E [Pleionea sp. CnH1-48]